MNKSFFFSYFYNLQNKGKLFIFWKLDEYIISMIKVFKIKDLIKYIISLLVSVVIINMMYKSFTKLNSQNINMEIRPILFILESNLIMPKNKEQIEFEKIAKFIISDEVKLISNIKETIKEEENNMPDENKHIFKEIKQADTNVTTEEVENSVHPKSTNEFNGVKINNQTEYELTEDMLNSEGIVVNKNDVFIYHTHTCESYTQSENFKYESTGNFRTTDLNFTVARVGDELETQLKSLGINVIHNKTLHDYPAYNGSYGRSLKTAEDVLSSNSKIDISIDLHRDAIGDETYAPKVKIGDEYVSQLMFVIGSDKANDIHNGWNNNLKFAIKVQEKANELYPGLFKPIILRNSEYNQHISKAACIIEVGSTGNTLDESIGAMKYLAKVIQEM